LVLLPAVLWLYWGWYDNKTEKIPALNKQQSTTGSLQNPKQPVTAYLFEKDSAIKNTIAVPAEKNNNDLQARGNTVKISRSRKSKEPAVSDNDADITGSKKIIISDNSLTKVKITNGSVEEATPFAEEDLHEQKIADIIPVNAGDSLAITQTADSLPAFTNKINGNKKADSLPAIKKTDNKIGKNKWKTRVISHAGIAVFSSLGNTQDNYNYSSPNQGTSGSPLITYQRYRLRSGVDLGIGIEKEKKLSGKLDFSAGLSYNFSTIEIMQNFYTDSLISQSGLPVYSNVSRSSTHSRLDMYSLEASLLIHYRLTAKKLPLRLSAGINNRLLFAGNWNHYKNVLGKKPGYMPFLFLNPSVSYKKLTAGPYLQLGLTKISGDNGLLSYGLGIKYDLP
jgi:hypothetical protein